MLNSINFAVELQVLICESLDDYVLVALLIEQLIQLLIEVVPLSCYSVVLLLHALVNPVLLLCHFLNGLMQAVTVLAVLSQLMLKN